MVAHGGALRLLVLGEVTWGWVIGLWVLIGGFVLGAVVAFMTPWRTPALIALGLFLPLLAVVASYLVAPANARGSDCSDCGQYVGRYWEPWTAAFLGVMALVAWIVGIGVARAVRAVVARS